MNFAKTIKMNVPFEVRLNSDDYSYAADSRIDKAHAYGNNAKSKRKIRAEIESAVDEALTIAKHVNTFAIVVCNDETILLVKFDGGPAGWVYYIIHKDGHRCCVGPGSATFEDAVDYATEHAQQSYGGVVSMFKHGT